MKDIDKLRQWYWEQFQEHYNSLASTAARILRTHKEDDRVKDILGNAMVKGFNKIHTLSNPKALIGWLRVIVRHECLDSFKRRKREKRIKDDVSEIDPPSREDTSNICEFDDREDAKLALSRVSPADRELLEKRFFKGMEPKEIAEAMGDVTAQAIRTRLCRAKARIAQAMLDIARERSA